MNDNQLMPLIAAVLMTVSSAAPAEVPKAASASLNANGLLVPLSGSKVTVPKQIGVEEFEQLSRRTNNLILDVRTPVEFEAGHIPGAVNIDLFARDFEKRVTELDRNKGYLVLCASGARSVEAGTKMSQWKFALIYSLEGGLKAWEKAGKTVAKQTAP